MSDYITNNVYAHNCESSIYIYVYTRVMSGPNLTQMSLNAPQGTKRTLTAGISGRHDKDKFC